MAVNVTRTTISLAGDVMKGGLARAKALGYKTFSAYVAYLIGKDVNDRPPHVLVRTEAGEKPAPAATYTKLVLPDKPLPKAAEEPTSAEIDGVDGGDDDEPPTDGPPKKIGFQNKGKMGTSPARKYHRVYKLNATAEMPPRSSLKPGDLAHD